MNSPKILSVLVPSRERPGMLKFSLDTLNLEKNNIEALVWLDEDDPLLFKYHKYFDNNPKVQLFIKKRIGYPKHHEMVNFLANQSHGDWFWLWNDDVYMDHDDWYRKFSDLSSLSSPKEEPVVYNVWHQETDRNLFPIVSRKYFELLGHFCEIPNWDAWIKRVAQTARIHRHIFGIKPRHRKYSDDEKLGDLQDNTAMYVQSVIGSADFNSVDKFTDEWTQDANTIIDWVRKSTNRNLRVGFIGLSEQEFLFAMAIESRGKNVIACNPNQNVIDSIQHKITPIGDGRFDEWLRLTKIEIVPTVLEVVKKSNLVFCSAKTPGSNKFGGNNAPGNIIYIDHENLKKDVADVVEAANKIGEKTTLVLVSPCLPGTYKNVIKPLLSPKVNYIYSPLPLISNNSPENILNQKSFIIGSDQADITPLTDFYKIIFGEDRSFVTDINSAENTNLKTS